MSDKTLGATLVVASVTIFTYYTAWVIVLVSGAFWTPVGCLFCRFSENCLSNADTSSAFFCFLPPHPIHAQPFVDPGLPVHDYFPDRVWAVAVPCVALVLGVSFVVLFIATTVIRAAAHKKKS